MNVTGIIAEYNPLHNGHVYHIEETRKKTHCDGVVVAMSGNIVQRGEFAILEKYHRALSVVEMGADLVFEIPSYFVLQKASMFAQGAFQIFSRIPGFNRISFGSTLKEDQLLYLFNLEKTHEKDTTTLLRHYMNEGFAYPKAFHLATEDLFYPVLKGNSLDPNDLLGLEYLRAMEKHFGKVNFLAVNRQGALHDSKKPGLFLSGKKIREMIDEDQDAIKPYVPIVTQNNLQKNYREIDQDKLYDLITYKLYFEKKNPNIIHYENGLPERLIKTQKSPLSSWIKEASTTRYTYSRIRRYLIALILNMEPMDLTSTPVPIIPLAMNQTGQKILASMDSSFVINQGKDLGHAMKTNPIIQIQYQSDLLYGFLTDHFDPKESFRKFPIKKNKA